MFSNIDDSTQTMDAIINYIMAGQGKFPVLMIGKNFLK